MELLHLTGQKFGRLIVKEFAYTKNGKSQWLCQCDCGKEKIVSGRNLISGNTQSCGCINSELNPNHRHGNTGSRLYIIWINMRQRCSNPGSSGYKWYGAKGIKVCPEWQGFISFRDWALSHGYEDHLTIDRIDSNKDYCPENCQWVTKSENSSKKVIVCMK